LAAGERKRKM